MCGGSFCHSAVSAIAELHHRLHGGWGMVCGGSLSVSFSLSTGISGLDGLSQFIGWPLGRF